jgi:hypothetical protein
LNLPLLKLLPLVILLFGSAVYAQNSFVVQPIICKGVHNDAMTSVLERSVSKNVRSVNSSIETSYVDFPMQAKTSFQKAVSIWESYIVSPQKIKIQAKWESLPGSTLAQSGATKIYRNFTSAPYRNVWYPVALAEAISGQNLNSNEFEITISLNRNINWSFSINGVPESNRFDMVSVVLHEIAHGLGFNSSFKLTDDNQRGEWGQSLVPYVFDIFVQNGSSEIIQDTKIYGNPSLQLKQQLTSNDLFFFLGNNIYTGKLPQLNAVDPFRIGASVSHLDEFNYPQGNDNSLMTPSVRSAEVIHTPGDLTLLILNQIGWGIKNLPVSGNTITATEPEVLQTLVYPNPVRNELNIYLPQNKLNDYSIIVRDSAGKTFYRKTDYSSENGQLLINTADWIPKIYFLEIKSGNLVKTHKVMVVQ